MHYKNKKKGGIYKILFHAEDRTNSRDGQKVVVYKTMLPVYDRSSGIYVIEEQEIYQNFEIK